MGARSTLISSLLILCGALLFLPFIGQVNLFDWDEINFAESAREMIVTGDYQTVRINFTPFVEKPPLFIWMQVFSMKLFGINEFAARFPNAICGILTMIVLFFTGQKLLNNNFGVYWAFSFVAGILPFLYFKSGIIDPWYNLFTFLALANFYFHHTNQYQRKNRYIIFSAFFLGLAILTKGPAALLIYILTLTIFIIFSRSRLKLSVIQFIYFVVVLLLIGGSWFIIQIIKGNYHLIEAFINYHIRLLSTSDAGHGGSIFYHFIVLFFLVFPISVLAIPFIFQRIKDVSPEFISFKKLMLILLIVILVVFTIVKTKIVHYSSLAYFPLSFFAAIAINEDIRNRHKLKNWQFITIIIIGLIYATAYLLVILLPLYKTQIILKGWIKDPFFNACLSANVDFTVMEILSALILPVFLIISYMWYRVGKKRNSWRLLVAGTIIFNYIVIVQTAPKVEQYSQHALIEFCESKQYTNSIVNTRFFFSYAPLFYSRVEDNNSSWPLTRSEEDTASKKVYVVIKINKAFDVLKAENDLKFLYHKNGYVFTEKIKKTP